MDSAPKTPLLDRVKTPEDLRKLEESELPQLADELRRETIDAVSVTGGHLGAGLGVVELTVALHWVFDTPRDRLVWDVGHQTYPHKIITGRRDRIRTLRAPGGLSGFTRRVESEYDPFGAAHSSTSISAGLGMAVARDLAKRDNNVVCVIGDGAMSAGMAYEALNNAGARDERLIVVLNDNDMSIAPPTGALSAYLARIIVERHLSLPARHRQAARTPAAEELGAPRRARRGIHAPSVAGRRLVRGARLLLRRPHRRAQLRSPAAGAEERARRAAGADPRPRRHQEGQRLRAGRGVRRQVSRRLQVQRRHRRAGHRQAEGADLHARLRRRPHRRGEEGRQDRRHHRRHARRHRPRSASARRSPSAPSTSASPSSTPSPSPPAWRPRA